MALCSTFSYLPNIHDLQDADADQRDGAGDVKVEDAPEA